MISQELLNILRCPADRTPLALADADLVNRLNQAVAQGGLKNQAGQKVSTPLAGGLIRQDRTRLYPIVDGIPMMLADEAIPLDQLGPETVR